MTLGERIKKVRGKMQRADFAASFDVHFQTLANYERDERLPDSDFLKAICEKYGINPTWLLLGEGPMKKGEGEREAGKAASAAQEPPGDNQGVIQAAPDAQGNVIVPILRKIIGLVESHTGLMCPREIDPGKKAQVIADLYDLFSIDGGMVKNLSEEQAEALHAEADRILATLRH